MIRSQCAFISACKNVMRTIVFELSINDDLQTIKPLSSKVVGSFDPELANIIGRIPKVVRVYHSNQILVKIVL